LVLVVALTRRVVLRIRTTVGIVLVVGNLSTFLAVICAVELGVLTLFLAPGFVRLGHGLLAHCDPSSVIRALQADVESLPDPRPRQDVHRPFSTGDG
jgi:hypothetical protein